MAEESVQMGLRMEPVLRDALQRLADDEHRSLNAQVIVMLECSLASGNRWPPKLPIAIKDAVLLWDDNGNRVGVTTQAYGVIRYEHQRGGAFMNSGGNCDSFWNNATDDERLDRMLETFVWMVDDCAVDESVAHSAFTQVIEWQNTYSDRRALRRAMHRKRRNLKSCHDPVAD